ncbi:hypothetical protein [Streptomyces caatingaensis]|uniref:hypothetical protein n=1 Tax=Streptomyces caatingaensis TaxID=1678637 RepID=UPI000A401580|nr:hypothetical protein [Streptomyces caatingaensis]
MPTSHSEPPRAQHPRPARPSRRRALLATAGAAVLLPLTGCAGGSEPVSAGRAPTVAAPRTLWAAGQGAGRPGPAADGIRAADPLATVKADVAAGPAVPDGPEALDGTTRDKLARCTALGPGCPVRPPEYHDLTGDGRDELIIGIDMEDGSTSLRAYTLRGGKPVRVLAYPAAVQSVQVAGRDLILWEDTATPDYRQRTVYSWDAAQKTMEFQSQEYRRVRGGSASPPAKSGAAPGAAPEGTAPRDTA